MLTDGQYEPNTVIIQLPLSVVARLTNGYEILGHTQTDSLTHARNRIKDIVRKYIPAGIPYVIIDENNNMYDGMSFGDSL